MVGIDQVGHCVKCHKNLIVWTIVNIDNTGTGELISRAGEKKAYRVKMPSPLYDLNDFALSDGSIMTCCMCKSCKAKLSADDHDDIFNTVFNGWQAEFAYMEKNQKLYPDFSPQKAKDHLEIQANKRILFNAHGLPSHEIKKKIEEAKNVNH